MQFSSILKKFCGRNILTKGMVKDICYWMEHFPFLLTYPTYKLLKFVIVIYNKNFLF